MGEQNHNARDTGISLALLVLPAVWESVEDAAAKLVGNIILCYATKVPVSVPALRLLSIIDIPLPAFVRPSLHRHMARTS